MPEQTNYVEIGDNEITLRNPAGHLHATRHPSGFVSIGLTLKKDGFNLGVETSFDEDAIISLANWMRDDVATALEIETMHKDATEANNERIRLYKEIESLKKQLADREK